MSRRHHPAFLSPACLCVWLLLLFAASSAAADPDWSVAINGQPPAIVSVGDVIGVIAQISVDAGADDLVVNQVRSGPRTTGLSGLMVSTQQPLVVAAGTSSNVMMTVVASGPPGNPGVHLEVVIDGTLGAVNGLRSASSNSLSVLEAVTATLGGGPPQVRRGNPIAYNIDLVNDSDTEAQLAVPDAGFATPAGTVQFGGAHGDTFLNGGSATRYSLVVVVSDSNEDGAAIVMMPTGVTYAMWDITLPPRAVTLVPASVSSIVVVPVFADGFQ